MLVVEKLVKNYGQRETIRGIDFTLKKGQIVGLLGKNGAGKSTTMNMITGCLAPTSGTVTVDGVDLLRSPEEAKKKIGYLPEHPPLYVDMTVEEYLLFVAELKGVAKAERKSEVALRMEQVDVTDRKDMLIKHLSKGYSQRVGMAQALIGNPSLIILDEPMSGLDPNQVVDMRNLIKTLGTDHTIMISSHNLAEIQAVCDCIIIIDDGQIIMDEETGQIEKETAASGRLTVTLKGKKNDIHKVLSHMKQIKNYEFLKETEPGVFEIQINATGDGDIRDALFVAFSESGLICYGINAEKTSLEDVSRKLTTEEKNQAEDASEGEEEAEEADANEASEEKEEATKEEEKE